MKRILFYINFLFFVALFNSLSAQISNSEHQALIDIYNSTSGDEWTNSWNLSISPENWHGVTIEDNNVIAINLHKNNLQGIIPKSIDQLDKLEELILFNNMLEGPVPQSIGAAKNLKVLNLSSNFLKGTLPSTLENLTELKSLELFGNKLSGTIEVDLGKLKNLSHLVLAYNNFEGETPTGLENLTGLEFVQLQGNKFDSYQSLEDLDMEGLATFDSDDINLNSKYNPTRLNTNGDKTRDAKETRMADTKFEKEN